MRRRDDVLPMHCSANVGAGGDAALFFGLSGTGKTTLSNDPARQLIGDDEHGWTATGVFNLEGGCYAKTVKLSAASEPEIFAAAQSPGTVLENVVIGADGVPDFDDMSLTENTRAAYPLDTLPDGGGRAARGPVPRTVVFLTADAFGVLPPLARLDPDQAVYHFLSGYTAKVAGTERGVTEPSATFSACFGAPFMPLHPTVYGDMLSRAARCERRHGLAAQHRLDRRRLRHGQAHRSCATRGALLERGAERCTRGAPLRGGPVLRPRGAGERAGACRTRCSIRGSAWADRAAYDAAAEACWALFERNFEKFEARLAAALAWRRALVHRVEDVGADRGDAVEGVRPFRRHRGGVVEERVARDDARGACRCWNSRKAASASLAARFHARRSVPMSDRPSQAKVNWQR